MWSVTEKADEAEVVPEACGRERMTCGNQSRMEIFRLGPKDTHNKNHLRPAAVLQ